LKKREPQKTEDEQFLPIEITQSNDKVAEARFICDGCGKLIKTSMISKKEADTQKNKPVKCYNCKKQKK
jgi:hypothetical protein